jgi:endonuclease/exonuclease/phosphatase (EEP) superfamily protein YafD
MANHLKRINNSKRGLWGLAIIVCLLICNIYTESIPLNYFVNTGLDRGDSFRILSYNIHCKDTSFRSNQEKIAEVIAGQTPDIVFLCEFAMSKCRKLDSVMVNKYGYQHYYLRHANEIFYSKVSIDSIYEIHSQTFSGCKRSLINAAKLNVKGKNLTVVGCHLSSSRKDFFQGKQNRLVEANKVYESFKDYKSPLIVLGDMNDFSGSSCLNKLKELNLSDAWWEAGTGYGCTFHSGWMRFRLDHILYNKTYLKVKNVKVIDNYYSDHNAIVASFCFE